MRDATIARNYAQALLALATKANQVDTFGALIGGMSEAARQDVVFRRFLEAPQISDGAKRDVLRKALSDKAPATFVRFIEKLISNRRQMIIPEIAIEYVNLVDDQQGRVHAMVTVAHALRNGEASEFSQRLTASLGKEVVAHMTVNPAILGGVIVRIGDTVMDGSVRRRLGTLRQALVNAAR
jgi:F-type H+-transporting ATPase subunit delta